MSLFYAGCIIFSIFATYTRGMESPKKLHTNQAVTIDQANNIITREPRIIRAARQGNWKKIIMLYEKGYPIDDRDLHGQTPLHIAASNNDIEMAMVLLQRRANPNARTWLGLTPLHLAVMYGHTGMTNLLLEFGAHHNEKTNIDETPVQLAAARGYVKILVKLLETSEFIRIKQSQGLTPQQILHQNTSSTGAHEQIAQ